MPTRSDAVPVSHHLLTALGCVLMAIGLQLALFILLMVFSKNDSDLRPISMFSVLLVLFFSGPGLGLILFQSKRQGPNRQHLRIGAAVCVIGLLASLVFYQISQAASPGFRELNDFTVHFDRQKWDEWRSSGIPSEYATFLSDAGVTTSMSYKDAYDALWKHHKDVSTTVGQINTASLSFVTGIVGLFLAFVNRSARKGIGAIEEVVREEIPGPEPEDGSDVRPADEPERPAETTEKVERTVEVPPPEKEEEEEKAPPTKVPVAETAPAPPSADGGNTPLIAAGLIIAVLVVVYLSGMTGPSHQGPHGKVVVWEPATFTLDTPSTITVTVANDGTEKGTFIIIGQFLRNRGMHVSPSTAKWEKEDLTKTVDLAPGEERTIKAFTLTPKELPTGEFGFRVRIYRTDATGERKKIEDDSSYKDVAVS